MLLLHTLAICPAATRWPHLNTNSELASPTEPDLHPRYPGVLLDTDSD